ncbi:MAG: hypothetical protein QG567_1077, partial [Campylobacterota bacterium]|nr:hypothetical protein [Campylobacterota bacterium]
PGYGLIDNRDGIKKRKAFFAFQFMITLLKNAIFVKYIEKNGLYSLVFKKENQEIIAIWRNEGESEYEINQKTKVFLITGEEIAANKKITIDKSVKYLVIG